MYKTDYSTAQFKEDKGIMVLKLHNSIDGDKHLKKELSDMAKAVHEKDIKKVLINNDDLTHPLSKSMQGWAEKNIELELYRCGVDKIAIVMPNSEKVFAATKHDDHHRRKYFTNQASATRWLNK